MKLIKAFQVNVPGKEFELVQYRLAPLHND
jgi:hypothetical protein